jgi:hypothetical protein
MGKASFLATVLVLGGNLAIAQQTLVMNGGQILHGRYDGGNADTVFFIDDHGNRHRFNYFRDPEPDVQRRASA